ncbi:hypothetical protein COX99_00725 [Candidatus Pacearchaeota archaeon CG_4_10_14_0_2_um_filter_31_10]|nr:MAG: hypothetical protein COX99_00725 [Candidatus Pacearchaeota archaeon CG_4_10_14_0_2_um_filter_31_10]
MAKRRMGKRGKSSIYSNLERKSKPALVPPKAEKLNGANILVLISVVLSIINGVFMLLVSFVKIDVFIQVQQELLKYLTFGEMVILGSIWIILGLLIFLINHRVKETRKMGWAVFLLIISLLLIIEGRVIDGALALIASIIYIMKLSRK